MAKEAGDDDFGDVGGVGTPAAHHTHHFSKRLSQKKNQEIHTKIVCVVGVLRAGRERERGEFGR